MGHTVFVTSRDAGKRAKAESLGADAVFEPGARLPVRVDVVLETVGEATWSHSLKSLRPGGTVVVCGATSGPNPPADLNRVFFTTGGGEAVGDVLRRVRRAWTGIASSADNTLVVTHAGPIRCLLHIARGVPVLDAIKAGIPYGSITRFER